MCFLAVNQSFLALLQKRVFWSLGGEAPDKARQRTAEWRQLDCTRVYVKPRRCTSEEPKIVEPGSEKVVGTQEWNAKKQCTEIVKTRRWRDGADWADETFWLLALQFCHNFSFLTHFARETKYRVLTKSHPYPNNATKIRHFLETTIQRIVRVSREEWTLQGSTWSFIQQASCKLGLESKIPI